LSPDVFADDDGDVDQADYDVWSANFGDMLMLHDIVS
jgi:hypothetical protein